MPAGQAVEVKKISLLVKELMARFVEREEAITAVVAALLTKRPALLIGPVGTAKTSLIRTLATLIGGADVFRVHLDPETTIDEILGPVDVEGYRRGQYRRITTGYLPDADIVLVHEVFRGSRAVRDALLDILEEGTITVMGKQIPVRAVAFYFDTNFVSDDEEDRAFIDRCTIRCFVEYVSPESWKDLIVRAIKLEKERESEQNGADPAPVMTLDDVRRLQRIVKERFYGVVNESRLLDKYFAALAALRDKGIEISDRMKVRILHVAAAISVICMEPTVSTDSLADALRLCVPITAEQRQIVENVIEETRLSSLWEEVQKLQALRDELANMISQVKAKGDEAPIKEVQSLKILVRRALRELKAIPRNPRLSRYVGDVLTYVAEANNILKRWGMAAEEGR